MDLEAIFNLADFNGDDAIDDLELSSALQSIGLLDGTERAVRVSQIMDVLDTNSDGVISRREFMDLDRVLFQDFLAALSSITPETVIQGMMEDIKSLKRKLAAGEESESTQSVKSEPSSTAAVKKLQVNLAEAKSRAATAEAAASKETASRKALESRVQSLNSNIAQIENEKNAVAALNTQLQVALAETKEMPARIQQLEDEILRVKQTAFIDDQEITRIVGALEVSKSSLDFELERMERTASIATASSLSSSTSEEVRSDVVWSTVAEYSALKSLLEESAEALREAQEALKRSGAEVEELRSTQTIIKEQLSDALAYDEDTAVRVKLKLVESELATMQARFGRELADALAELETARNALNRDNREALVATLQREIDALAAERDAAVAREKICHTELDHLRQRRNAGASAAYTDLQDTNELLQQQVDMLEEALRAAQGNDGEHDALIDALVREIAALKDAHDQMHEARIASLERRLDRVRQCSDGDCGINGNVTQEVRVPRGLMNPPRGIKRRVYHRRVIYPAGQQSVAAPQAAPSRTNVMVKVNKSAEMSRLDLVGKHLWFRLGQKRVGLVDGQNKAICAWPTGTVGDLKLTGRGKTLSFTANGEALSFTCKDKNLAQKAFTSLQTCTTQSSH